MKRDGTLVQNIEYAEICKVIRQRMKDDINNYHEQQQLKALEEHKGLKSVKRKQLLGKNIITLKVEDDMLINDLNRLIKRCEEFYLKLYSIERPQDQPLSIAYAPPPPQPPHILPLEVRVAFVRGTSNINRTSIMFSLTSKRHSTGCGAQHFGKLRGCTISIQTLLTQFRIFMTSAVCFNDSTGDRFRTTVGVRQGCLLSLTLFNIFLERIMPDAFEDHKSTVSSGGRTISNLRFADDINGLAGSELELANLVERLDETSTAYGMQISAEKTKLMTNNTNGIRSNIRVNGEKLETIQSFKYLGAIVTDEGSMPEICSRIAQTIAALTKLKIIWDEKNIDLSSKIRLLRSLVMSILLYSCQTWTLTAEIEEKIQTVEMRSFRRLLGISYKHHITNEEVRSRIQKVIGPYKELLSTVKRRKMKWYGHVTRALGLAKTVLQGTVRGREKERQTEKTMGR